MSELSGIGLVTAFAAGTVSFLSPCVLPLVPGYLSYVAGQSLHKEADRNDLAARLAVLGLGAFFVLGFSTVFILLGASATALGSLLLSYRYEANLIGGVLVILFGLLTTGIVRFGWLQRDHRFHAELRGGHPLAAYTLGLAFAFGWTPCIGPVLGAILTVSAATATVSDGITLLALYSLGLGIPFLLCALFASQVLGRLRAVRKAGRYLQLGAGALMVAMGAAMITGKMTEMSYWFLETFPALARIG
ncbi:cytochrome c biogenesis CcdA family protein [Inquilinus sp. Marseille-Q2685]|uniref:cytochrome c biogenesis CcdA family protein n=1 Tax=Inquilinus sp. Marseille-Q2685 TaxID=2866581 RepID=UPI001CE3CC19|nr:cytochrome c biogenesis protein CcdA [Inquilinus sp. Marseille-Q2685]